MKELSVSIEINGTQTHAGTISGDTIHDARFKYARNPKNTQHNCRKSPNWLEHTDFFRDIITDTGNILKRGELVSNGREMCNCH